MRSVKIAELKNHLSAYLNEVRDGEEIIISDRDTPIAKIIPLRAADYEGERLRAATAGKIRLGSGEPIDEEFWNLPAPKISMSELNRILNEERDED